MISASFRSVVLTARFNVIPMRISLAAFRERKRIDAHPVEVHKRLGDNIKGVRAALGQASTAAAICLSWGSPAAIIKHRPVTKRPNAIHLGSMANLIVAPTTCHH